MARARRVDAGGGWRAADDVAGDGVAGDDAGGGWRADDGVAGAERGEEGEEGERGDGGDGGRSAGVVAPRRGSGSGIISSSKNGNGSEACSGLRRGEALFESRARRTGDLATVSAWSSYTRNEHSSSMCGVDVHDAGVARGSSPPVRTAR